ncbi:uncharacterized protein [Haliotis cracherodii]|uniref:uncharacterized protein isoform X1 n=1 Tax=Haliotis cracherodii TaxID=6455 RepID=UPI0039E7A75A
MKPAVSVILSCLCFALCQDDEPDYDNLLYGGIWRLPAPSPTLGEEDISKAVETAIAFLEQRTRRNLRKPDGSLRPYTVQNLLKMKLVFTSDDREPYLHSVMSQSNKPQPMSTLLVFGSTYTFHITWTSKDFVFGHNFIVTMYPKGNFHIFAHTSTNEEFSPHRRKNQTTVPFHEESSSSVCSLLSSGGSQDAALFATRSCTLRRADVLRDLHSCDNSPQGSLYTDFGAQTVTKSCVKRSDIYLNFTVMTYNTWNFNSRPEKGSHHYVDRIKRLGQVINAHKPDIIAFQEVRFEYQKGGKLGPNQAQHLADMLQGYQFVYQPAQLQPNSVKDGRTEEGVAVFSRYPITSHHSLPLFRNQSNSADLHQRMCQHVEVQLPNQKTVHIFNTHLSLSHEAREQSVMEMWNYMRMFEGAAILTGDLNAEPQENAIRYLREKTSLIDTWQHLHGNRGGYTFNTLNKALTKRIDYIFVRRQNNVHILDTEVLDDGKRGEKAASDHVPLVANFGFS